MCSYPHVYTLVSTSCIMTLCILSLTRIWFLTFINVLTRSSVDRKLVSYWTSTPVSTWFIITGTHTLVDILTLIQVLTGPPVFWQMITLATVTSIWTPQVDTLMAANVRNLYTFIYVHTRLSSMFESRFTNASIGPWVILTFRVYSTKKSIHSSICDAFVDILTHSINFFIPRSTNTIIGSKRVSTSCSVKTSGRSWEKNLMLEHHFREWKGWHPPIQIENHASKKGRTSWVPTWENRV